MEIGKYEPVGFFIDKKPTSRMLYDELIDEAFERKGNGDEATYQKIMSKITIPNPNDVWGDALDMTNGKPPIPDEKIGSLFATFCISK